jgi:carbamoyl-phosphate synthase large subunit
MANIGLEVPRSALAHTMDEARVRSRGRHRAARVIRPAFTLGGSGGGIAYNLDEFEEIARRGLDLSPIGEVLIEESVLGWKEFEMEVMRDTADNVVIICSIENIDAMGVHTGDSVTVAPAQTLTDKEYQICATPRSRSSARSASRRAARTSSSPSPATGRMVVIEMNPRVSRSSALASKATGFPIAKIAAKLAVGYTLDEVQNDITRETPAVRADHRLRGQSMPRWAFEKFPRPRTRLTTQMKSVGEAMAIGRTFKEAFQKAHAFARGGLHGLWHQDQARCRSRALGRRSRAQHRRGAAAARDPAADAHPLAADGAVDGASRSRL